MLGESTLEKVIIPLRTLLTQRRQSKNGYLELRQFVRSCEFEPTSTDVSLGTLPFLFLLRPAAFLKSDNLHAVVRVWVLIWKMKWQLLQGL